MGSQVYKHFYQEFKTRFKVFLFNLDNRGGHVRITERSVTTDFNLEAAFWILESARTSIFHGKQGDFRKIFKGSHCKIIMDTGRNKAGNFLRILKVEQGRVKNIIVPGETQEQGWKDFSECLHNIFSRKIGRMGISKQIPVHMRGSLKGVHTLQGNERKTGYFGNRSWKDVVMQKQWAEEDTEPKVEKKLNLAVVIYRYTLKADWETIRQGLGNLIHRRAVVIPLAADRAITWCLDEEEKSFLIKVRWIEERNRSIAKMENWTPEVHLNHTQIAVNYSWIGLEGIPLNLWNIHAFKIIGEVCGGLLEVTEETLNKSFLRFAKLKVKGLANGLMNPLMELPCGGVTLHIGIFSLGEPDNLHGGFPGLLRRSPDKVEDGDVVYPHITLVPHHLFPQ